jgi:hypothetical protein
MSAIRKTKRKSQPPRSSFTFVRQSKNNPKPDDNLEEYFNEDNLQNYFDEDNEGDNNNNQQQEDMMIEDSFQEYSNDDQEYSSDDQTYSNNYFNDQEDSDQEYIGDDQDEDQYGSDDQDEDRCDQDDSDQEYIGDDQDEDQYDSDAQYDSDDQYNQDDQDEDQDDQDEDQDDQNEDNFKNITSLMMFTWITKHMIGNNAYKDLVNIINNENFDPIDVPKNIQTLKKQRKCLPLHKIKENIVNINKEKTSSNSQPTKMAYSISIIDHIREILNNSQIAPRLYFGPGIETDKKSEFWHGTIWQESPLFGKTSIIINRSKFYLL